MTPVKYWINKPPTVARAPTVFPRSVDHTGFIYAVRSYSNHSFISKEGYGTVKQQWMFRLAVYHPIYHTERVLKIYNLQKVGKTKELECSTATHTIMLAWRSFTVLIYALWFLGIKCLKKYRRTYIKILISNSKTQIWDIFGRLWANNIL